MAVPSLETLAELYVALSEFQNLSGARRNEDGTVSIPNCASSDCTSPPLDKSVLLSLLQTAVLCEGGGTGGGGTPTEIDLSTVESLLQQLLDSNENDIEVGEYTLLCSSSDPTINYLAYFQIDDDNTATPVPYYLILGSNTPIQGFPSDAIRCEDSNVVESCYYVDGDPIVYYQRITALSGTSVLGTTWIDENGTVSTTAPVGAQPCVQETAQLLDCETC